MEFTGKTLEEAIELAISHFGVNSKDDLSITVLEEPTKGLFGKMKGKALIIAEKKAVDGIKKAVEFLEKTLSIMGIEAEVVIKEDGENKGVNIVCKDSATLIGKRGEVLDALQTLVSAVANTEFEVYKKVEVDCENYREKRKETLIKLAKKLEIKATELKRDVKLEPMSAYERRIIHTALADSESVTTKSEGQEPNRYVLIVPNDRDESLRPYDASRNGGDKKRNGKNGSRDNKFSKNGRKPVRKSSGTGEKRSSKTSFSFGTFLGNSMKDNNN